MAREEQDIPSGSKADLFESARPELEARLGDELFASGVAGDWLIFQRSKGHRHGLDDALVAWFAAKRVPHATRLLDLGSGVGSVGLCTLWQLPPSTTMVAVEAQAISYALLASSIRCNKLHDRVSTIHSDLRALDQGALDPQQKFDLITGSPPYFPIGTGVLPNDSQKAHARFELRGHVGDYARTALKYLADGGVFVYVFPSAQHERSVALVQEAGFQIETYQEVYPTPDKPPLFSLYSAVPKTSTSVVQPASQIPAQAPFYVQDSSGRYTDEMVAMQAARGFGPDGTNIKSNKRLR